MIPGITTKLSEKTIASAATIDADKDVIYLTTTTAIATIIPHFGGGFSGIVFIIPTGGNTATLTTGNISGSAITMLDGKITMMIYSKATQEWYSHALS